MTGIVHLFPGPLVPLAACQREGTQSQEGGSQARLSASSFTASPPEPQISASLFPKHRYCSAFCPRSLVAVEGWFPFVMVP